MPKRKIDSPGISAWANGLSPSQRQQYLPLVRSFLTQRDSETLTTISDGELVTYVCSKASASSRTKIICALQHFFGYTAHSRLIDGDPSCFLRKLVQGALADKALANELHTAGIAMEGLSNLSWRDVAVWTVAQGVPKKRTAPRLNEALRKTLVAELLQRLQSAVDVEEMNSLLDVPLLPSLKTVRAAERMLQKSSSP